MQSRVSSSYFQPSTPPQKRARGSGSFASKRTARSRQVTALSASDLPAQTADRARAPRPERTLRQAPATPSDRLRTSTFWPRPRERDFPTG